MSNETKSAQHHPYAAPRRSSATLELARRIYVELVRTDAYRLGTDGYEGGSLTEMAEAALDAAEVFEACVAKEGSE